MKKYEIENQTGGELGDIPNDKYRKFFTKFEEIQSLSVVQYKPVHLLGYFCKKFAAAYGNNYKFKYNSPSPSKCFEIFQIKRLAQTLSSKPEILINYIDWIFLEKVEKEKKKFRSISFLTNEDIIREYKMNVLLAERIIDRSTLLPTNIKQSIISMFPSSLCEAALTYGDLAFLRQGSSQDYVKQIDQKLLECNFDISILEKIK